MKNWLFVLCCLVGFTASVAHSAAPVTEIGEGLRAAEPVDSAPAMPETLPLEPPPLQASVDSYTRMQFLQEEVMQLRGMIEELSNEVRQLKQRQMDDYMDLHRRLTGGGSAAADQAGGDEKGAATSQSRPAASAKPASTAKASSKATSSSRAKPSSGGAEAESYNAAYKLLKAGQIDKAVPAFKAHIERYPSGSYTPNSYYWLGEVYLLKNDLEQARQAFTMVSENYPAHRKAADATFKLGKVYHLQGNQQKAKALLEKVASRSGPAASLAQKYLNENF